MDIASLVVALALLVGETKEEVKKEFTGEKFVNKLNEEFAKVIDHENIIIVMLKGGREKGIFEVFSDKEIKELKLLWKVKM